MKNKNAIIFHQLHSSPQHLIAHIGDMRYKVLMDGKSFIMLPGGFEFPAPGCPVANDRLIFAQFVAWLTRNRRWWPVIPIIMLSFFALQALLLTMPEASEMRVAFIAVFSHYINIALVVLLIVAVVALALYNFGKGVTVAFNFEGDKAPAQLGTGDISIAPDVLVMSESVSESTEDFAVRLESAREAQKPGEWVVSIPFRHPAGVIIFNPEADEETSQGVFYRDEPPFEGADWPADQRTSVAGTRFERESYSQYCEYLHRFTRHFPEWSKGAKLKYSDPAQAMANTMRRMAHMFAFMLFTLCSLSAQKDAQVAKYLGEYRYNHDRPAGTVAFVFQKAVIKRTGDGKKTYHEILPDAAFYNNEDNAGKLIGITVGKTIIFPESPAKKNEPAPQASVQKIETLPGTDTQPAGSFWESMPDSSELEGMKAVFLAEKSKFGQELSPRKNFLTWMFWQAISPILILIGLIAYYIARSAFAEAVHDTSGNTIFGRGIAWWGHRARYFVFIVVAAHAVVIIIDMAISDYFKSTSLWWWFFKSAFIVIFAYWLTKWIVPNPRVVANRFDHVTTELPRLNR